MTAARHLLQNPGIAHVPIRLAFTPDEEIGRGVERSQGVDAGDPELWNRRGLIALGNRHERQARDYLGRALRLGSTNAAVVLARLDLIEGDLERARRGFRALSWSDDPGAWTQRGLGLAHLPVRRPRTAAGTE